MPGAVAIERICLPAVSHYMHDQSTHLFDIRKNETATYNLQLDSLPIELDCSDLKVNT